MPLVEQINALEPEIQKLSDEQLRAKTAEFKSAVRQYLVGELGDEVAAKLSAKKLSKTAVAEVDESEEGAIPLGGNSDKYRQILQDALDSVLPESFAVVREAGRRVLNMRHFDVQLIGGMVLHQGKISEMKTGEGKTLVATLPVYLNALSGRGVHVVTVNDYLAKRDSEWMGKLYR